MTKLPSIATRLDLLKWVLTHPNQAFDPTMVISTSTGRSDDGEWRAVEAQMEQLKFDGYLAKLRQSPDGSSFWSITQQGERYLKALTTFEDNEAMAKQQATAPINPSPAHVDKAGEWEQLKRLGGGGQSEVFLVRSPNRVKEKAGIVQDVLSANPWAPYVGGNPQEIKDRIERLSNSVWNYARPDSIAELGALKRFRIPDDPTEVTEALARLNNEVTILRENRPGLVKLLDANEAQRWIVTELMPYGTLQDNPTRYRGNALTALLAFRSLVSAVSGLHRDKYVHRDIKPANVFVGADNGLLLGDFGIVFIPHQPERPTITNERVGPRDYMPQWGDLGERLEKVHTNFDVYMLGKLLWCMVSGRLKLPREYFDRAAYDVRMLFPNDSSMHAIDSILRKTVVEEPQSCLPSAAELLALVDEVLGMLSRGGQLLGDGVPRPCRVCGRGQYLKLQLDPGVAGKPVIGLAMAGKPYEASVFECNYCHHVELFRAT